MLNRWNSQKKCLVVDDEFYIRLSIGAQLDGILKYSAKEDGTQFPLQIFDSTTKKDKFYDERFYLLLTKHGLEIGNFNKGCKLCSEKGEVTTTGAQRVIWCDQTHPSYFNLKAGFWQLIKTSKQA